MATVVDDGVVSTIIDAMRRDAEAAVASVQATLGTVPGKNAIAQVVAGYYNALAEVGAKLNRAHTALAIAMARPNPSAATQQAFLTSVKLMTLWTAMAQGFTTYVREATPAERAGTANNVGNPIAVAAVVVAVAGAVAVIAVSATGVAWAVVHYAQANNLRAEVDLLSANPATADALAKINQGGGGGPGGPDDPPSGGHGVAIAVGVTVLAATGLAVWAISKKGG